MWKCVAGLVSKYQSVNFWGTFSMCWDEKTWRLGQKLAKLLLDLIHTFFGWRSWCQLGQHTLTTDSWQLAHDNGEKDQINKYCVQFTCSLRDCKAFSLPLKWENMHSGPRFVAFCLGFALRLDDWPVYVTSQRKINWNDEKNHKKKNMQWPMERGMKCCIYSSLCLLCFTSSTIQHSVG